MPDQKIEDHAVEEELIALLTRLHAIKPNDRSPRDRHYAVTLTQLELAHAYFHYHVIQGEPNAVPA